METLRPQEAIKMLIDNIHDIANASTKVMEARNKVALAEAAYLDVKTNSLRVHLVNKSASAAQVHAMADSGDKKTALILADSELKQAQDTLKVLETSNNNYKMAIRIMNMEAQNLSFSNIDYETRPTITTNPQATTYDQ